MAKINRRYADFKSKVDAGKGCVADGDDRAYTEDYNAIVGWFQDQETWTEDLVRIGALVVYGWMPTILRTGKMSDLSGFAERLQSKSLRDADHSFVNGSFVGTSKFLHFWQPNQYAIWDNRICQVLGWGVQANTEKNFFSYQDFARTYANSRNGCTLREVEQSLFLQSAAKTTKGLRSTNHSDLG